MSNRIIEGYNLYQKGSVDVKHYEDDHIIFEVKKNDTESYIVSMIYGYWNCDCADYVYRNQRQPGSFYCKHLQAAQFKLLDILKNKEGEL
ncbi:hypothetical protein [Methanosphaera cuniculi]|uniref:SWIM-type domain-containing protein n=1 Tax=Methanosphaera cuniculi TaxID=1077256 RepID=A0A2A2HCC7_9EURY|nr:hypothetical protein [Methanosphaera cuniculi]PAV07072.1 hypothetical protein ASJ82_02250 [Methanosphaera cuniculi]PWL07586.1 hypothetical protein MSCUN_15630 [Methanosphaera cuniculi]